MSSSCFLFLRGCELFFKAGFLNRFPPDHYMLYAISTMSTYFHSPPHIINNLYSQPWTGLFAHLLPSGRFPLEIPEITNSAYHHLKIDPLSFHFLSYLIVPSTHPTTNGKQIQQKNWMTFWILYFSFANIQSITNLYWLYIILKPHLPCHFYPMSLSLNSQHFSQALMSLDSVWSCWTQSPSPQFPLHSTAWVRLYIPNLIILCSFFFKTLCFYIARRINFSSQTIKKL